MSIMDDKINSLSSEELDLLMNDPQLQADFKAKYTTPEVPKQSSMMDVAKQAIQTALPSPDYNKPLSPTSSNSMMGALEVAGQTLRDPTRISPTVSQPGQLVGEQVKESLGDGLGAKIAGGLTGMALDPQSYIMGGEGASLAGKGLAKVGGALESLGTKSINSILGIRPKTLETIAKAGENPAEIGVEVGKLLARDNVISSSGKKVFENFTKGYTKAGEKVRNVLSQITEGGTVEMPASEALQPLFDAYQKIGSAMTSTRRAMAKPFKDVFGALIEKAGQKGNMVGLEDVRQAMSEVGPMTHKGAEETKAVMSELYGKLADVQDHMITSTANVTKNPVLKEQLLEANRDFSIYSRIAHDVKHQLAKSATEGIAPTLTTNVANMVGSRIAGPMTKAGSAMKGFPISAQNANEAVLQGLKQKLGNSKGSFTLGPESRHFNPEAALREKWGDLAREQSATPMKIVGPYVHPEAIKTTPASIPEITNNLKNHIKVFVKGVQKGAKGAKEEIYGVKGKPEVLKALFGDETPASVPKHILQKLGLI